MEMSDIGIDRECADNLRSCIYRLYDTFAEALELSRKERSVAETIGINPKVVSQINSAFTFLVSRNRGICRDGGMLHTGCNVGLTLGDSIKYLQVPNVDVVVIRFNAFLIFGALLFTLFLVEIERGALVLDQDGEEDHIEKLKKFLRVMTSSRLVDHVKALPANDIVHVVFLEPDSSAGYTCH